MIRCFTRFTFALGLMLLCAAALVFVRGFWACDETRINWLRSAGGGMYVDDGVEMITSRPICRFQFYKRRNRLTQSLERRLGLTFVHHAMEPIPFGLLAISPHLWERLGFFFEVDDDMSRSPFGPGGMGQWRMVVGLPTWLVAALGAIIAVPPGWSLRRARRHRIRRAAGLCPSCGYDLRGTAHER